MKILRRNLSLMLAVRYLNPLRSMFSIITLICLLGVALGVMVLIVVLSVMEGLQREMQDKVLAFTPHYIISKMEYGQPVYISDEQCDWEKLTRDIGALPEVSCAFPRLESDAFAQSEFNRMTVRFTAIQPHNTAQIGQLKGTIRYGSHDFGEGLNEECIISAPTAKALGLMVGDKLKLTPVGSLDGVADIYAMIQEPLQTHEHPELRTLCETLFEGAAATEAGCTVAVEKLNSICNIIQNFKEKSLRQSEINYCENLWQIIAEHLGGEPFSAEQQAEWNQHVAELFALDRDKEDGKAVKSINEMVLPVDLTVIGIYQMPENMPGPNIYVPLKIAQDSLGFSANQSNSIMGICVRLKDPNNPGDVGTKLHNLVRAAGPVMAPAAADTGDVPPPVEEVDMSEVDGEVIEVEEVPVPVEVPEEQPMQEEIPRQDTDFSGNNFDWEITPWTKSYEQFYELIANERVMMSFVLSIISLIASFCIMSVMFTMSMQRRREIAVLQALGATPGKIMGIFTWQGVVIGLLGAVLGVILALLVLYYRLEIQAALAAIGMDPFPMEGHGITLPAAYEPATFIHQAAQAFIMVVIASIIPAFVASRQDPAKALRSN